MDRKKVIPPEIELELKKFELKISKLNKEEMFKELMLLKFDSENNFYFIKKYLSKHGMKISRQIIQSHNTDHVVIAFGYLSEKIHKLFKKNIFPEVKNESKRLINLLKS
jgi:ATP-dependent RNA circularization protein (DNA/RNA ligase family)